ncbi:hypothetical protein JOC77_001607 [Peribacillus deserti]|uniref:Uncharacterized protein n=1 Tax=Peribacillus deserti TaxID=673318 RepID=A0ABS2QG91_9BACI|nr:hypothetical protein [Peribacillus deserti]MBM7692180.1 hypothetical protein [Peribacillus deserti]
MLKPNEHYEYKAGFSQLKKGTYTIEFTWGADQNVRAVHQFGVNPGIE